MRLLTALAALTAVLIVTLPASATDPAYVPFGPYGSVTLAPTFAGTIGLTVNAPQWSYGAIETLDCKVWMGQCVRALDVAGDGQVWVRDTGTHRPRLVLSTDGYDGADVMSVITGGSPVATVSSSGEWESWGEYAWPDAMRFSTYNSYDEDSFSGGLDRSGRYVTLAHTAPDPRNMRNGEAREWFDPTPGTGGMMSTMKFSDGSVKTVKIG